MLDITTLINQVTLTAAAATIIATQILKSKLIPVPFQNQPVATTILVSLIATWIALINVNYVIGWHSVAQAIATFIVVLGTAATVYTNSIHNWDGVRNLEAPKSNA